MSLHYNKFWAIYVDCVQEPTIAYRRKCLLKVCDSAGIYINSPEIFAIFFLEIIKQMGRCVGTVNQLPKPTKNARATKEKNALRQLVAEDKA